MIYLIAIVVPPLALLLKGKIFQAIINGMVWGFSLILFIFSLGFLSFATFPLWVITVIWAVIGVKGANDDERTQKIVDAIKSQDK
jgi:hypothetical protein